MAKPVKSSKLYKSPHKLPACSVGVGPEAIELQEPEPAYALGCTWLGVTQLEVDPAHKRASAPGLTSFSQVTRMFGTKRVRQEPPLRPQSSELTAVALPHLSRDTGRV